MSSTQTLSVSAPSWFGFVHEKLPHGARWRCIMLDRGRGMVVGLTRMGDTVTSFDVELDSGEDVKAAPCALRPVTPAAEVAQ